MKSADPPLKSMRIDAASNAERIIVAGRRPAESDRQSFAVCCFVPHGHNVHDERSTSIPKVLHALFEICCQKTEVLVVDVAYENGEGRSSSAVTTLKEATTKAWVPVRVSIPTEITHFCR
jgi:hypothetical protein